MILWGENDNILGVGDVDKFVKAIVNFELIWIFSCGYVFYLEKLEVIVNYIFDF